MMFEVMLLSRRLLRSAIRFVLVGLITFAVVLGWSAIAYTQLPSLPTGTSDRFNPPSEVDQKGEYETAPVRSPLDDEVLFTLTSPAILNRHTIPEGKLPVEVRAREVNERLWRVFNRTTLAKQTPTVSVATLNNRPIIQISDDRSSRPIRLVTVTEPDADMNGKTLDELAQEWQKIIQDEVIRFRQLAAPEVILQRVIQALQMLLGLLLASGVIWFLRRLLTQREAALETRYQEQLTAIAQSAQPDPLNGSTASGRMDGEETEAREIQGWRSRFLASVPPQFSLKRQLNLNKFLKWALFWIFIVMWYIGIAWIVSTVPVLMRWSLYVWATPSFLLLIWFGISLAIRVCKSLIDRFLHSLGGSSSSLMGDAQRTTLRSNTIAEALKGFITFVLIIVGIVLSLELFDIPTTSILAGGAVLGLAISFGTQSLIKDLVNGCLILIEDQYAVGDVIQIGDKKGLVENLNLRVTQLRSSEGELITIPNSNISNVSNLTRLWSRVNFSILVAYENDPKRVLEVLRQVSQQMYDEPEWRDRLPEPPMVLGIDDLSHAGMLVRVWIKTVPMEQWSVGREFRFRVRQAFTANGIEIGRPQEITFNTELINPPIELIDPPKVPNSQFTER
jgi:moderate conductance mechanosensitive channel